MTSSSHGHGFYYTLNISLTWQRFQSLTKEKGFENDEEDKEDEMKEKVADMCGA